MLIRFAINGVVATLLHFSVLTLLICQTENISAGLANGFAALFGITCSFFGARYFVFKNTLTPVLNQLTQFYLLYLAIALIHTGTLYLWSDVFGQHYAAGFVLASGIQVVLSYTGNKEWVFKT
jgi:putative flippase GtrA